jgi:sulfate adenylyltransferase subunit 2
MKHSLTYLEELESESIYVLREAYAQFENPCILFSGGKDSIVLTHLAKKAFWPANLPFKLLHIDTGHNFPETISFRDKLVQDLNAKLVIANVQEAIDSGLVKEETGVHATRNNLQIKTLLKAIDANQFDACMGGARRDEEKSRAKERFFSHRNEFGQWDPKNQRPELWTLFNGLKHAGESFRVFPLSNWTELDIWNYIKVHNIELPSLYYSHTRTCFRRGKAILAVNDFQELQANEVEEEMQVRFRTMGDITITGAVESTASSVDEIIAELQTMKTTERGGRADDFRGETAMEDRKKQGYF